MARPYDARLASQSPSTAPTVTQRDMLGVIDVLIPRPADDEDGAAPGS